MKLVLFVEGHTEKKALPGFLRRWLDPQVPQRVGVKVVRFEGWADYVKEIPKKVALNLSGRAGADVIAGIGLLDLYGPTFYPNGVQSAPIDMLGRSGRSRNPWGTRNSISTSLFTIPKRGCLPNRTIFRQL